jgi:hypothetical protein
MTAMNFSFNAIIKGWQQKEKDNPHEILEGLIYDIARHNSLIYRRMQIRKSDSTGDTGEKGEGVSPREKYDTDKIYRIILEETLDEMNKITPEEKSTLHQLIMEQDSMDRLAQQMNTTTNALRVQKSRLIASLFSRLGQPGLLSCWLLLLIINPFYQL